MDAPPAPIAPGIYMTPQLAKRRDGLAPSLLLTQAPQRGNKPTHKNPGGLNKPYRTSSLLLLQAAKKDLKPGSSREDVELQCLVDSVHESLQEVIGPKADGEIVKMDFIAKGCTWKLEFAKNLNDADQNYYMQVVISANRAPQTSGQYPVTNYEVDTVLVCKVMVDPNPLAPTLKGYREAKAIYDNLCLVTRKAVVKLEFPEFPEGCKGRAFREVYQLNARLKSGSFATVCRGTHRATGRKVAIKCVLRKDLPPSDDAAIYDEVAIMATMNHPHIVPLIDFFDEKDCYFLVMELMSGGDLFDRIGKKKHYSEADARDLVMKMLKAMAYCHTRKIAHCDMKPKNLLLMSDENDSYIKLADFGFAARVHEPKSLTKQCGTPFFVAPEILMRKPYDQQADMWSVGCIVFLLLSGNLPFMGRSQKELFRKIVAGKFEFDEDDWGGVSEDAKDLVTKLLMLNPDERITASEAVRHKWLKISKDKLSTNALLGASQRLKTFNARMKLRSAMIAIDWVSGLKRMSWMSSRNVTNGSASAGASSASGGSGSSGRQPAAARNSRSSRDDERKVSSATKGVRNMSVRGDHH